MFWCLMFISLIGKLSGITTQSTDYEDDAIIYSVGKRAADGVRTVCSHTEDHDNSTWRINLKGVYNISAIRIYHSGRYHDYSWGAKFQIYIGNSHQNTSGNKSMCLHNITKNYNWGRGNRFECKPSLSGRYVTLFSWESRLSSLCKVEIYGSKKESPFLLIKDEMNWEDALNYCRQEHMDLASILNDEDQAWAELEARNASTPFVWLGLRYTCTLGFWFWVQNHCVEFNRWDLQNKTEGCETSCAMQTNEDHLWYTKPDNQKFNFFCAKYT